MADEKEKDYNDLIDEEVVLCENRQYKESYEEGLTNASQSGNPQAYHVGYHRGVSLGCELGYYLGIVSHHLTINEESETPLYSDKVINQLKKVQELINTFPQINSPDEDILGLTSSIRAQYKKACALLKISSANPENMDQKMMQLKKQLDSITKFITPYLPLVNCHMVEFLTEEHWSKLVPKHLSRTLKRYEAKEAIDVFFEIAGDGTQAKGLESCIFSDFIRTAQSHCLKVDNEYCLSVQQFQDKITSWGAKIRPEIKMKEFMTEKKSYEVQKMAPLVAALYDACATTHCVDAGGGRGHLPIVLDLGYSIPSLAVDCDEVALEGGRRRDRLIKKQWKSIARNAECDSSNVAEKKNDLHKFVHAYITKDTDLEKVVRENFPEHSMDDVRLLLIGMHTCGNLGPSCIHAFIAQKSISAIFNVPCCYHLLTEQVDDQLWDIFERNYGAEPVQELGFPMSQHLKGFQLGRNARMLASQSIERVVKLRQLPSDNLFYRALLQVLIKKYLPQEVVPEGKLKRLTKCRTFDEYFKMADSMLNLNLQDKINENDLIDLCTEYESERQNLVIFYYLRLCFAQVIESVILLDRLLFLFENGVEKAFLVKLFDPTMSPRCHSIVAIK